MNYVSTRGQVEPVEFQDAVLMGLADDGGLIIPQSIPAVADRLGDWRSMSYSELAFEVIRLFASDIPPDDLRELINRTYGEAYFLNDHPSRGGVGKVAPVVRVGECFIQELWHGPTLAFKDVALQLLGNLFEYILARRGGRLNILGATSGDTGSAAIAGCRSRAGIDIFIMHPHGRVTPIQERQMTTVLDANVHNIAIDGSFDDSQRIMKTLAADLRFKRKYSLGAVNSVNWARVLAQIVYYFAGVFDVQTATGAETVRVCVPTGNFGDILAGWYAMRMGCPISQLILATNENNILARFFNTGRYSLGEVHHTLAPAMDIQVPSNFERYLYYRLGEDPAELRRVMQQFASTGSLCVEPEAEGTVDPRIVSDSADTGNILEAIRRAYEKYDYVIDPHTACGWSVAERVATPVAALAGEVRTAVADEPVLCLATAHPGKFPDAIRQATGKDIARHPAIDALAGLPTRCELLPNDEQAVRDFIIRTIG